MEGFGEFNMLHRDVVLERSEYSLDSTEKAKQEDLFYRILLYLSIQRLLGGASSASDIIFVIGFGSN